MAFPARSAEAVTAFCELSLQSLTHIPSDLCTTSSERLSMRNIVPLITCWNTALWEGGGFKWARHLFSLFPSTRIELQPSAIDFSPFFSVFNFLYALLSIWGMLTSFPTKNKELLIGVGRRDFELGSAPAFPVVRFEIDLGEWRTHSAPHPPP